MVIVLILLSMIHGDLYSKVLQMPAGASQRDCVTAGAQWITTQKEKDSPQYLCVVKSDFSKPSDAD